MAETADISEGLSGVGKKLRKTGAVLMISAVLLLAACFILNMAGIEFFYRLPYLTAETLSLLTFFIGLTLCLFNSSGSTAKRMLFGILGTLAALMTAGCCAAFYRTISRQTYSSAFTVAGLTVTANEKLTKDSGIIVTADIEIVPHIISVRGSVQLSNTDDSAGEIIQAMSYRYEDDKLMVYVRDEPIFACQMGEKGLVGRPRSVKGSAAYAAKRTVGI